ncbi:MAG: alkaline phosphatase family protein [Thermoplasmata archaeon]|nr:alkaline phosphatase family protein [Thermoplasmata archaeon]
MRTALVILDGLGDRPHPDTGGVSPVEAARTPHLDQLCRDGRMGDVVLVGPGIAPESDAGVLALLGYDPVHDSPGRGVLEAVGVGVSLEPGDVAMRLNFATSDGSGVIRDARVGRNLTTTEAERLAAELTGADLLNDLGIQAEVRATVGHRGVLWLHPRSGGRLSPEVTNSDPFYEKVGGMGQARRPIDGRPLAVAATDPTPEARRTAGAVNEFLRRSEGVLAGSSVNARRAVSGKLLANTILLRNAGSLPDPPMQPFAARTGFDGAAVTEMPVERGIARLLGLTDLYVGPMGLDRDRSLGERAEVTRKALSEHSFVYVHLKGPDEPGHDGQALLKKEIIESLDRAFFGPFLEALDWSTTRLIVTADHATPCVLRGHSDDPVPLVLRGAGVAPDPSSGAAAPKFSERSAGLGSLGHLRGLDVLGLLGSRAPPR